MMRSKETQENILFTIGPYQILESIGKGGMGEVYLAYDTTCGRKIALKRIREDLATHSQLYKRFLREAKLTSQLIHPAIIPIYSIHQEQDALYYTMPFVEGKTLKQIIKEARAQDPAKAEGNPVGRVPSLMRYFLSICQAVAYAHSRGILHRDLKLENVIIGKYGEVMILDWGLAKIIEGPDEDEDVTTLPEESVHTLHGKVVGTISYMAPERAFNGAASVQSDIFSLGVILYNMLTLSAPFRRGKLEQFRKTVGKEEFRDPAQVAPYRDVPRILTEIAQKCLERDPKRRYESVDALLRHLEIYMEGKSEWFVIQELDIARKRDWEFQENVFIAEHIAITRNADVTEWVNLMISKDSFSENIQLEATVKVGSNGHGLGFLLSLPEVEEREHINDGYCLWLGSDKDKSTKLLRSTVEVLRSPHVYLKRGVANTVKIQKVENNIYCYVNNVLQFSYISYLPLTGTHIGILSRDLDFEISPIKVGVGNLSINIKCLAVPDAFLAHKDFERALHEYRRIGYSFPGRAEGRDAMFRAGITLLEQAKTKKSPYEALTHYDLALDEFQKLHSTPGAPLEYLGKSLVYKAMQEFDEEIKCFEIAFRRYPKHPLLPLVKEQAVFRLHESSLKNRRATYNFALLIAEHMPQTVKKPPGKQLFQSLVKHWEPLPFFEEPARLDTLHISIVLAFWTAKPYVLEELLESKKGSKTVRCNALFALLELGCYDSVRKHAKKSEVFQALINQDENMLVQAAPSFLKSAGLLYLVDRYLTAEAPEKALLLLNRAEKDPLTSAQARLAHCYRIWSALLLKDFSLAEKLFAQNSQGLLTKESTLLPILYGCFLRATLGKEMSRPHLSNFLDVQHPRTWTLLAHYLFGKIGKDRRWESAAFLYEKRALYKQMGLYALCKGDLEKARYAKNQEKRCYYTEEA